MASGRHARLLGRRACEHDTKAVVRTTYGHGHSVYGTNSMTDPLHISRNSSPPHSSRKPHGPEPMRMPISTRRQFCPPEAPRLRYGRHASSSPLCRLLSRFHDRPSHAIYLVALHLLAGMEGQACLGDTDFQMRARMSPLPVAKRPPVGLGATEMTG